MLSACVFLYYYAEKGRVNNRGFFLSKHALQKYCAFDSSFVNNSASSLVSVVKCDRVCEHFLVQCWLISGWKFADGGRWPS